MHLLSLGALPCLLIAQASAQSPLSYQDIQRKARLAPEHWRTESLLAERQLQLQETRGILREGPTLSLLAGPRRNPITGTSTDKGFEVDLPLFLSPRSRVALESSLGKAHPLLVEAARREGLLRLKTAYLDAWLATRLVALREADLGTVARWLETAQTRLEAGADPEFQVALVAGERLKVMQELDEARTQEARAWSVLVALADLPADPVPLADPGPTPEMTGVNFEKGLAESPLRKALLAQVDLEAQSLRLKEAQALSRWSLRGTYTQEGEDKITRFGVAVRLPRPGESRAIQRNTEAQLQAVQGESRQALAELDARATSALARFQKSPRSMLVPDFTQAVQAVSLRLQEGRDRPSEALPIRRQLLEAQMASLRRTRAQHLLAAELQTLLSEVNP